MTVGLWGRAKGLRGLRFLRDRQHRPHLPCLCWLLRRRRCGRLGALAAAAPSWVAVRRGCRRLVSSEGRQSCVRKCGDQVPLCSSGAQLRENWGLGIRNFNIKLRKRRRRAVGVIPGVGGLGEHCRRSGKKKACILWNRECGAKNGHQGAWRRK